MTNGHQLICDEPTADSLETYLPRPLADWHVDIRHFSTKKPAISVCASGIRDPIRIRLPMADDEILIFALEISDDGVREMQWDDVCGRGEHPQDGQRWLHFSRFSSEARDWLITSETLPPLVCDVLFQDETRPSST